MCFKFFLINYDFLFFISTYTYGGGRGCGSGGRRGGGGGEAFGVEELAEGLNGFHDSPKTRRRRFQKGSRDLSEAAEGLGFRG